MKFLYNFFRYGLIILIGIVIADSPYERITSSAMVALFFSGLDFLIDESN